MSPITELIGGAKAYGWGSFAAVGDFESIATVTVSSEGQSTIEFTSIPSTYTHLQLRSAAQSNRSTYGTDYTNLRVNGDSGSNYSRHYTGTDGSTTLTGNAVSSTNLSGPITGTSTGGSFATGILDILDYSNTNKYKTIRTLTGNDLNGTVGGYGGELYYQSGTWLSTAVISSLVLTINTGPLFTQHSKFALYGIRTE